MQLSPRTVPRMPSIERQCCLRVRYRGDTGPYGLTSPKLGLMLVGLVRDCRSCMDCSYCAAGSPYCGVDSESKAGAGQRIHRVAAGAAVTSRPVCQCRDLLEGLRARVWRPDGRASHWRNCRSIRHRVADTACLALSCHRNRAASEELDPSRLNGFGRWLSVMATSVTQQRGQSRSLVDET